MAKRLAVFELAKELGLKSSDILAFARKIDMPISRSAAMLTTAQAEKLRRAHSDGRLVKRVVVSRVQSGVPEPPVRSRQVRCSCCSLPFETSADDDQGCCDTCIPHREEEGEAAERTIERLSEHLDRFKVEMKEGLERSAESRKKMRAALESRDKWRRATVEVLIQHAEQEDGSCSCGDVDFPCVTRRFINACNRGIAREIERLEGLPWEDLWEFFEGGDHNLRDPW